MENKDFLINTLKLADGIKNNNKKAIEEFLLYINSIDITPEEIMIIKDFFKNENANIKLVISTISNINCILNKESLIAYIKLRQNEYNTSTTLSGILNTDFVFDDESEKFVFYTVLVKKVINFGDSDLIKAAIDKVQTV